MSDLLEEDMTAPDDPVVEGDEEGEEDTEEDGQSGKHSAFADIVEPGMSVDPETGKPINPDNGQPFTGTISHLDKTGDVRIRWDKDNPADVASARAAFGHLTSQAGGAHMAFKARKGGVKDGDQIREFDPDAQRILLVSAPVGG